MPLALSAEGKPDKKARTASWWRKAIAAVSAPGGGGRLPAGAGITDLTALVGADGATASGRRLCRYLRGADRRPVRLRLAIGRRSRPTVPVQVPRGKRRFSKRTRAARR
ncbi:MAG: hypothetical protein ACLSAF_21985 [Intestinimonas sp.]